MPRTVFMWSGIDVLLPALRCAIIYGLFLPLFILCSFLSALNGFNVNNLVGMAIIAEA